MNFELEESEIKNLNISKCCECGGDMELYKPISMLTFKDNDIEKLRIKGYLKCVKCGEDKIWGGILFGKK